MSSSFDYLEGKKFCVVFVKVLDEVKEKVQMRFLRGRASLEKGHVNVVAPSGNLFTIPGTAMGNILPNDGTVWLKDAEYFCLVKVDKNVELVEDCEGRVVF